MTTYAGQSPDAIGDAWRNCAEELEATKQLLERHERAWRILQSYSTFGRWLDGEEDLQRIFRQVVPGWKK